MNISETPCHSKDEDLERLMEIHSDVKLSVQEERKKNKIRFCYVCVIILLFAVLGYFEYLKKTKLLHKIVSFFVFSENQTRQENIIPMTINGRQLIVIPENLPVTEPYTTKPQQAIPVSSVIQEDKQIDAKKLIDS